MLSITNRIQNRHLYPPFVTFPSFQRQLHMMSGYILLTLQLAVVSLLVILWHSFQPNTWSNRVVSCIINVGNTPKVHQQNSADCQRRDFYSGGIQYIQQMAQRLFQLVPTDFQMAGGVSSSWKERMSLASGPRNMARCIASGLDSRQKCKFALFKMNCSG